MRKHILAVDDEPLILVLLQRMMNIMGHDSTMVEDGQQAIAMIEQGLRPDLIIMDLYMPLVNGAQCMEWIRLQPDPIGSVPIIALSAANNLITEMAAQADYVMTKPFTYDDLRATITHAIQRNDLKSGRSYVPYQPSYGFSRN